MTQRVQIRRNIDTEIQKFIGEPGELIYNLTTKRLHTNDGSTLGGHPLALLSEIGSGGGSGIGAAGVLAFRKSGDGITRTFTITASVASEELTQIYLNGIYQQKDTYGVTTNGATSVITFDTAPIAGTNNIEIIVFVAVQIGQPIATTSVVLFSGTGSRVSYTLPTIVNDKTNTQIYINGVYQQKASYSASGVDLIFTEAPPAGTNNIEVVIIATAAINSGITAARPIGVSVGFQFYDVSLKKPVYWDGALWRDAAGVIV